jgi:hypothetical protein
MTWLITRFRAWKLRRSIRQLERLRWEIWGKYDD